MLTLKKLQHCILKMKGNKMKSKIILTIAVTAIVATSTFAKESSETVKLLSTASTQKMLSQRLAKDYLYLGNKVASNKAKKQFEKSMILLDDTQKALVDSINDEEIKNLLSFVKMSSDEFKEVANEAYSLDNAQLILDLSESMLEGSEYVVNTLKETMEINESNSVVIASRQSVLAQRIAKYYIAYQSGIKDKNTIIQMKDAVKLFSDAQKKLMANETNTPELNRKLNDINRLWKIVYKFYLNIEKGGLPLIVFNTTDKITKKMNTITNMYMDIHK